MLNGSDQGTFGILAFEDFAVHTLELPDRDNQPNISRIPAGEYIVTRRYSPSFRKELYWLKDVPSRSYVLIHGANFAGDIHKGWQSHLAGCIALGMACGYSRNRYGKTQKCVFRSQEALRKFEERLGGQDFKLIIKDLSCSE